MPLSLPRPRVSASAGRSAPALLEFQSPTAAMIAVPVPLAARHTVWIIALVLAGCLAAIGLIPIDRVVTAQGKVSAMAPTLVVQPLETSIVRSIEIAEGQRVRAGQLLARLDPTFAAADMGALASQTAAHQAAVSRLRAEIDGRPFDPVGNDPALVLQAAIFAQHRSERDLLRETYRQRIGGLEATLARSLADAETYQARKRLADQVVSIRQELERRQVGSRLNSLLAADNGLEIDRSLADAADTAESQRREIEALKAQRDGEERSWRSSLLQQLSEETQKLDEAQQELSKARLRRQLVELRAERDAIVLSVAKVSVGSVLQSGEPLVTMVPTESALEVEANIVARDAGFVRPGASVVVKFDTFPFAQYGLAYGRVRTVSADSFTAQDDSRTRSGVAPANPPGPQLFYRCRITLEQVKLRNVPSGFRVVPGMPVTADIEVGRRTVLAYLLGRVLPTVSDAMREP
jgi:HlyD family secretion protein